MNGYDITEELAAKKVEFNQQLRAILATHGISDEDAIKISSKLVEDWDFDDDSLEDPTICYEIGTHKITFEYKEYGITYEDTWMFEDYTKHLWMRDFDLLSGLLTCDKMREQGL